MYDKSAPENSSATAKDLDTQPHPITRNPLPASSKVYVDSESMTSVKVPMRKISLTDGTSVTVYDTSGPYTDPAIAIDVHQGLKGCSLPLD